MNYEEDDCVDDDGCFDDEESHDDSYMDGEGSPFEPGAHARKLR